MDEKRLEDIAIRAETYKLKRVWDWHVWTLLDSEIPALIEALRDARAEIDRLNVVIDNLAHYEHEATERVKVLEPLYRGLVRYFDVPTPHKLAALRELLHDAEEIVPQLTTPAQDATGRATMAQDGTTTTNAITDTPAATTKA
jgi:hypothetical protein